MFIKLKDISGKWYSQIGNTICIQPGQFRQDEDSLIYVLIDLETMNMERKIINRPNIEK